MKASRRKRMSIFGIILILTLVFIKCSKDDNPIESTNDFSGLWTGTITSNLVTNPAALTITITQTGNKISGTYSVVTGAYGTVAGTINNNSFSFTLTQITPTCTGSFSGQGTINSNNITFSYSGNDCWGAHTNGSGTLTRYIPGSDVICPLYVGQSWTYIDSTFNTTGTFVSRDSSRVGVIGKGSYNYQGQNIELFYWNWINIKTGKPQNYSWLMRNDNDGLNTYGGYFRNQASTLIKSLRNKFPVNVGDSWNSFVWSLNPKDSVFLITDTTLNSCTSTNQLLKTPAGDFNCYVYYYQKKYTSSGQQMTDDVYTYFAKNKGYIGYLLKTNGIVRFKKVLKY